MPPHRLPTNERGAGAADRIDLFEHAPCGLCTFTSDGTLLAMNATGRAMLGLPATGDPGPRRLQSLLTTAAIPGFERTLAALVGGAGAGTTGLVLAGRDGMPLPVVMHLGACRDTSGAFLYGRGAFATDWQRPTPRKGRGTDTGRYREVVELQTELVSRFKPDGRLTFVNAAYAAFVGRSPGELIGETVAPLPLDVLAHLTPNNPTAVIEIETVNPVGEVRWLQTVYRGLFGETGKLREVQGVGRDITERKVVESTLSATQDLLEDRVLERTAQLRRMAVDTSIVEDRQRQAIARDLHDDLGQTLHVAKLKLDLLAKALPDGDARDLAATIDGLLRTASARVRSLTSQISPPVLTTMGLVPALRWLGEELKRDYGLRVDVRDDGAPKSLSDAHAAILFRSVRELLINVARHAGVDRASVDLAAVEGRLVVNIADAGTGIADLQRALDRGTGFGLAAIRERIAALGGETRIRTAAARGTDVELHVPMAVPDET